MQGAVSVYVLTLLPPCISKQVLHVMYLLSMSQRKVFSQRDLMALKTSPLTKKR